jgi:polyferredoxin
LLLNDRTPAIGFDQSRVVSKGPESGPRTKVIGFSAAFAFVSVLFAYQLYVRVPLDFWVLREEPQPAQQTVVKGHIMNAYSLVVENRSFKPEVFRLSVGGISGASLSATPNPFLVPPNTALKIRFSVVVMRKDLIYRTTPLRFVLENVASKEIHIEQEETFIYPSLTDQGLEI